MIRIIRQLDSVSVFGSHDDEDDVDHLIRVIERKNFSKLPEDWSRRGEERSLACGLRRRYAGYLFKNQKHERAMKHNEAWWLMRAPNPRLLVGHPVGWDF